MTELVVVATTITAPAMYITKASEPGPDEEKIQALDDDPADDVVMLEESEEGSDGVTLKEMFDKQKKAEQVKLEEAILVPPLSIAPPSVPVTALTVIPPLATAPASLTTPVTTPPSSKSEKTHKGGAKGGLTSSTPRSAEKKKKKKEKEKEQDPGKEGGGGPGMRSKRFHDKPPKK